MYNPDSGQRSIQYSYKSHVGAVCLERRLRESRVGQERCQLHILLAISSPLDIMVYTMNGASLILRYQTSVIEMKSDSRGTFFHLNWSLLQHTQQVLGGFKSRLHCSHFHILPCYPQRTGPMVRLGQSPRWICTSDKRKSLNLPGMEFR